MDYERYRQIVDATFEMLDCISGNCPMKDFLDASFEPKSERIDRVYAKLRELQEKYPEFHEQYVKELEEEED